MKIVGAVQPLEEGPAFHGSVILLRHRPRQSSPSAPLYRRLILLAIPAASAVFPFPRRRPVPL